MQKSCHADKWPSMMRCRPARAIGPPSMPRGVTTQRPRPDGGAVQRGESGATMSDVSDLQQLVESRLRELGNARGPLSTRQAAARAGGKVSYETLRLIRTGRHSGSISQDVAEGLALALDVPWAGVLAVAGRRIPQGPFVLPKRAEALTKSERGVVLSVVDAILDAAAQNRAPSPPSQVPPGELRPVAHEGDEPGGSRSGSRTASETARRVRRGQEPQR